MASKDKPLANDFFSEATNSAVLFVSVAGGIISSLVTIGLMQKLDGHKWWLPLVIGLGVWLLMILASTSYRLRHRRTATAEQNEGPVQGPMQVINVRGDQLAPNINAPNGQITVLHDSGVTALLDAVNKGSATDILGEFSRQQAALRAFDPWWTLTAYVSSSGERALSLQPREPESYERSPITINFHMQATPEFPSLEAVLRHMYASRKSVSIDASNIQVSIGSKRFVSMPSGVMKLGIPDEEILFSPVKISVPQAGISYDYIRLAIRSYAGVTYLDNKDQENCPLGVSAQAEPNADGMTMKFGLQLHLTRHGARTANQYVKFLTGLRALAEGAALLITNLSTEQTVALNEEGGMAVDAPAKINDRLLWWNKVVALERHLSLTFNIPDRVSEEEFWAIEHLWEVLIQQKAEHQMPPMTMNLLVDVSTAHEIIDGLGVDKQFAVQGHVEAEGVFVFGTTVTLPERLVTVFPINFNNPEVVDQNESASEGLLTLRLSSDQPVTVIEVPEDKASLAPPMPNAQAGEVEGG